MSEQKKNRSGQSTSTDLNPSAQTRTKSDLVLAQFGSVTQKEERKCEDCGVKFTAEVTKFLIGSSMVEFGGRYCPGCRAKRDSLQEEHERQVILLAAAVTRRHWRETCGIPFHFLHKDFNTWDKSLRKPAYKLAAKYAEEFPVDRSSVGYPSLLMYSKAYGVGKTHLATSIGHRILDRSACLEGTSPIMFITETDIMLRIRSTYDRGYSGDAEAAIYGSLKGRALLILDDVGKEQPQDPKFMQRVYFHVIDGRYQRRLPMVITSNLDMEEIFDHIGGAAADRIFEMTQGNIVELKGQSYRRLAVKDVEK